MSEQSRDEWVRESAEYIREKMDRDAFMTGRQLAAGEVQGRRDEIKEKLESANRKAAALVKALEPLLADAEAGNLDQFNHLENHIRQAREYAAEARTRLQLAEVEGIPPANTRKMPYHRSAVRLAVAYDAGPGARQMAREIIEAADLGDYADSSLGNWLKEAREN